MSSSRITIVITSILLSLFMASMEATVVATAMPTIVGQLGGLSIYSWVFALYMLTSTTTVPIYGKLSDLYGRRPIYAIAMVLFLFGSVLCGLAQTMEQLIVFRAIQGLGAGGVMPMAFIIIGDLFTLEQRAKMQGLFSGVWGVSSIIGPLLGGFLVDRISWHWVFFVNVIPGAIALLLFWLTWQDRSRAGESRVAVDYLGTVLLTLAVVALLMGLAELETTLGTLLLVVAAVLLLALLWVEGRASDPVLPLALLKDRLFAVACGHGLLAGWAMFGSLSFVPLFVQTVLGTSATAAGATLTPMLLGWVTASIIGSRLLLRMSYRALAVGGMALLSLGALLLARTSSGASQSLLMLYLAMMGIGMGLSIPSFMIAVQSTIPKRQMGTATSSLSFSRSIGGTLGVSVMGALLARRLASGLRAAGFDPAVISLDSLLDPLAHSGATAAMDSALAAVLGNAIAVVFVVAFIAAALGLAVTALAPGGQIAQLVEQRRETAPAHRSEL
jgi:EmrB/QacA subfamily drug resistance transporter